MISAKREENTEPLRLRAMRTVGAGDVEQRVARACPRSAVADEQRASSPIRAWRAADTAAIKAPQRAHRPSTMPDATAAGHHPAAATATGPPPNGPERTARMHAVEQAWKAERARQAEFEAAQAESEARQALRQAEELEEKRQADERMRRALERAKRFRAEVSAKAGEQQASRADRSPAGRSRNRTKKAHAARERRAASAAAGGAGPENRVRHAERMARDLVLPSSQVW